MTLVEGLLLGLVQGLTEFLPVSSSGHLALGRAWLGLGQTGALFEAAVHLATACSILTVFAADIRLLCAASRDLFLPRRWRGAWSTRGDFRLVVFILLSAVPAGLAGILLKERIEDLFDAPRIVAIALLLNAGILVASRFAPAPLQTLGAGRALLIGLAQAIALVPGISRSGSTITAGLFMGLRREAAGRFAFLMALIPILGAAVLEAPHFGDQGTPGILPLAGGMLVAYASGVFALRLLLRFVARGRLDVFAPYCAALGILGLLLA
jgi:undecaprenyl-diphosphatase